MKKILSLLLILTIIFSTFTVFADEKTDAKKIKTFEGVIITQNNDYQLATITKNYNLDSENKEIMAFLKVIANNGVKVYAEGTVEEDVVTLTYIQLESSMPTNLQSKYETFLMENSGLEKSFSKTFINTKNGNITIKNNDTYILSGEDANIQDALELFVDTNEELNLSGKVFSDNKYVVSYIEPTTPIDELDKDLKEKYIKIYEAALSKYQKKGVVISYGNDTYLLVEKDTNKMYYLKTDDETIRGFVPIIANQGYQVQITYLELTENMLNVVDISLTEEVDEELKKELEDYRKKVKESILYYIEGYIKTDKTDYNIHYETSNGKIEVLGIISSDKDVATVIKTIADDDKAKVKLQGYINAEETLIDARKITLLSEISEESKKELNAAFSSTSTSTIGNTNNPQQQTTTTNNNNNSNSNNTTNNTTQNTQPTQTTMPNNNVTSLLGSNFGDFSSFFSNFDMSNFGNFSSLLNTGTTNSNTTTNNNISSLFSNFDMSNFGNFSSILNNGTDTSSLFSNFGDLFSNFNSTSLFSNLNLNSMFGNTNTENNSDTNTTSAFATIDN